MNKKLITAAVLAGLTSSASAIDLYVNNDNLGQVLLYPYYTTANGNTTDIVVVNTTDQVKALKVRYTEGANSWEVLDFNLYLSPYDVWAGGVSMRKDGTAPFVYTGDSSCTVPKILGYADAHADPAQLNKQTLRTTNITTNAGVEQGIAAADLEPGIRIQEGYIEIIEMGEVVNSDGNNLLPYGSVGRLGPDGLDLRGDIIHAQQADGTWRPNNCANLEQAWASGSPSASDPVKHQWYADSLLEVGKPTGGIFGVGQIINVEGATARMYDAVALDNVYASALHSAPGTVYPDLSGSFVQDARNGTVANANDAETVVGANIWDVTAARNPQFDVTTADPEPLTGADYATIRAITAALNVRNLMNIFNAEVGNAAMSDWVITFPTKHEFVNVDTVALNGKVGHTGYVVPGPGGAPLPPFSSGHDINMNPVMYNSEEKLRLTGIDFSPSGQDVLPFETNVISFSDKSILKSNYGAKIPPNADFRAGWVTVPFDDVLCAENGECAGGKPAIGFGTTQLFNGVKSYSTLNEHIYTRTSE